MNAAWKAGLEHGLEKHAAPRWAKEIRSLLKGIDQLPREEAVRRISKAETIARYAQKSGFSPRQIANLGQGADAHGVLMAGKSVGGAPSIFVAKMMNDKNIEEMLKERSLVSKILGKDYARSHGTFSKGRGGVEIQDWIPFNAEPGDAKRIADKVSGKGRMWPKRKIWDVDSHGANVRRTASGIPVAIDARFDSGPKSRLIEGTVRERWIGKRRGGSSALKAAVSEEAAAHAPPRLMNEIGQELLSGAKKIAPYAIPALLVAGVVAADRARRRKDREKKS